MSIEANNQGVAQWKLTVPSGIPTGTVQITVEG